MTTSLLLLLGIHVLSLAAAGAILFEYKRIQWQRANMFQLLEGGENARVKGRFFVIVYVVNTLLIIVGSTLVFFFQSFPQ